MAYSDETLAFGLRSAHLFHVVVIIAAIKWDYAWNLPLTGPLSIFKIIGYMWVNMEQRWNVIDRDNRRSWRKLSQCHIFHHKSHMAWPESELGPMIRSQSPTACYGTAAHVVGTSVSDSGFRSRSGSRLSWQVFRGFSQSLQANFGIVTEIRLW
jgi:hypothetical protein